MVKNFQITLKQPVTYPYRSKLITFTFAFICYCSTAIRIATLPYNRKSLKKNTNKAPTNKYRQGLKLRVPLGLVSLSFFGPMYTLDLVYYCWRRCKISSYRQLQYYLAFYSTEFKLVCKIYFYIKSKSNSYLQIIIAIFSENNENKKVFEYSIKNYKKTILN